ncbi:peptide chain release factor-like protein [Treponema endosymbiont of Eucomonympha sp.]|uniref:peptide chain release factor-like protein n=1 Tax=Treponema endosymbiont of Eucomonympha sp. TaxID=1580831 RepID=UPI0007511D63|nr:peptide chain release factor-like protein [Treponema endosymbiont of Eucomonympha sp.]
MNRAELRQSIENAVSFSFAHSGGAGGQNVNKRDTKVHAACAVSRLRGLNEQELREVRRRLGAHISKNGETFVDVQDERTQERNRAVAVKRLEAKIAAAARIPAKRKKTRPHAATQEKRLRGKRRRSLLKMQRMTKASFD